MRDNDIQSISGAALKAGNGLEIHSSCPGAAAQTLTVSGLAIHSFPYSGISISATTNHVTIAHDFIGLDPTGTLGMGNGLWGVAAFSGSGVVINSSNISGNGRSGVYLWSASAASVSGSRMFHNGACGIFDRVDSSLISGNEIGRNGGFGVAVARGTKRVVIDRNLIYENVAIGIDRGLDSLSINDPFIPNAPVISDATYDPATNTTLITMRIDLTAEQGAAFGHSTSAQIFANSKLDGWGRSDADRVVFRDWIASNSPVTVRVPGDLRGQTITAMANIYHFTDDFYGEATEISNGVVSH